ncbi:MAG: histidine--tRNA ligase [Flavobacteriales bacterium]|nr:histidine--tRNA ligase [Flavobacteriales bacterium]|tara:strand:+ start:42380 stop:43714 length:1335 start_codon:yes stop_codon:yes gene_type:complete
MGKPSIPKGTRDFLPKQMARRNYIFNTAQIVFKKFGFQQIETPAIENLSTLTGKYGDEGDQLMFKILNRGDKFKKAVDHGEKESDFAELALKYDQTVPLARFVAQHQNEIVFPFKRFQIQPVWRADRPGKGRYREFYQCDIDVVGTDSLICEVEFIQVFYEVLTALKIPDFNIKINNRKVLAGIAEVIGEVDKIIDITVAIDKLDKIGIEKVNEELASRGLSQKAIDQLQPLISFEGSKQEAFSFLRTFLKSSETGMKGVEELAYIVDYCSELNIDKCLTLDLTLARGLNYYTGAIFEVSCKNFKGSICGGGRYDGLTDQFGLKGIGCAGISFGADRIYDVLEENNLFPQDDMDGLDVLFVNFGLKEEHYVMTFVQQLRSKGLSVEVFPTAAKMKKQLSYADYRNAKHVVMIGENEMNSGTIRVKNMLSGHQEDCLFDDFFQKL